MHLVCGNNSSLVNELEGLIMKNLRLLSIHKIIKINNHKMEASLGSFWPFAYWYKYLLAFFVFLTLTVYFLIEAFHVDAVSQTDMQQSIASEIIRFHVIANSDSESDQALKLKVKTALTNALYPILNKAKSVEEARELLENNLVHMENLAIQVIKDNGFTYTANASLEIGYFPLKVYGDLSLPPGEYEAIRVELGAAKGQNWWCIMFPPLCFVDATYSVVPKESKEQLKYVLTEEEYNAVFAEKNAEVKVKFKLLSLLKDLLND